jgi:hypothetical protein
MINALRTWAAPLVEGFLSICDGVRTRMMTARPVCVQRHRVRPMMEG